MLSQQNFEKPLRLKIKVEKDPKKIFVMKKFERESPSKKSKQPPLNQIRILNKNQVQILESYNTYPLRKNLVPEISADPQIGVDILSEENPLFPTLLHPRCDCSTEL